MHEKICSNHVFVCACVRACVCARMLESWRQPCIYVFAENKWNLIYLLIGLQY